MDAPRVSGFDHVFVPAPEPSSRLLIVLHGLGDSYEGFSFLPHVLQLPKLNYLLLNAPDDYYGGYAWFDLEDPAPGIIRSRGLLQGLLAELAAQGVPSGDTMLLGFSQGCLMSIDVGLRHDQPLAGVVGISGFVAFLDRLDMELRPQALAQRWLVTHGDADELLPLARTRGQIERLQKAGVPIAWHEFHKGHTLDPDLELPLIREWIAAAWKD
jgi:phospholipase/carboxylesterase